MKELHLAEEQALTIECTCSFLVLFCPSFCTALCCPQLRTQRLRFAAQAIQLLLELITLLHNTVRVRFWHRSDCMMVCTTMLPTEPHIAAPRQLRWCTVDVPEQTATEAHSATVHVLG